MDLFESDYWKLTVFLQKAIGFYVFRKEQWKNYLSWFYVYGFTTSFSVSMGVRWVNELGLNQHIVLENALGEIYLMLVYTKLTASILYRHKFKRLYTQVANDWKVMRNEEELQVMHKYTAIGSKGVKLYSSYMIIGVALFLSMPVFSPLLDFVFPLENATRPKALPYYAEYGIDIEEYYYPMITQAIFGGVGTITVFVTFDLGFIMIVQHVVALFNLVNFRLSKAAKIAESMAIGRRNNAKNDFDARHHIVKAIELHQTAMKYVDVVEKSYNVNWLIILFLNMVMVGGGMVIFLTKLSVPEESVRYAIVVCAIFIHFYYIFLPGQKIIDSSESVFDQCYGCNWYNLSEKNKTLIRIIMLRSLTPCQLTGGKMFVLCMDTYCNMMKTGFSIFTVLNT